MPISYGNTAWCDYCQLHYGAIRSDNGQVRCPICRKSTYESDAGVIPVRKNVFQCTRCSLVFGWVAQKGRDVEQEDQKASCPVCTKTK